MSKSIIIAIIMVILLSAGAGAYYYFYMNEESETLELEAGWNDVTFTQEQINTYLDDSPETVFASIIDGDKEVSVYQEQDKLRGWTTEVPEVYNDLYHILPNVICEVHVTISCTLTIG